MFGRRLKPGDRIARTNPDGTPGEVMYMPDPCAKPGHGTCALCVYPKRLAAMSPAEREAEQARNAQLRADAAAQVAAGTYPHRLGVVSRTTVDVEPTAPLTREQTDQLQDLAYQACDAAAALALAERTRTGLRAAQRAEKRTWAELLTTIQALSA